MRSMQIGGGSVAEVKWIKLTTDMFDNAKIKYLRTLPEGNNIVLFWVMLLAKAGKCNANGYVFLTESIPYTQEMLASEFDFDLTTVKLALESLKRLNMIELEESVINISNWNKYQNIDGLEKIKEQTRKRVQKHREKQKMLSESEGSVTCNVTVTECNATDIDIDKEKDIDKDIKKNNKEKKKKETEFDIEINNYTNNEKLKSVIYEFIKHRKTIKANMTTLALKKLLNKLDTLATNDVEKIKILENSIVNGWKGVFPLHDRTQQKNNIQGFNNFEGRNYNYDDLEKKLLGR